MFNTKITVCSIARGNYVPHPDVQVLLRGCTKVSGKAPGLTRVDHRQTVVVQVARATNV